ncbi:MAG: electron transfer flavoprotein subunit alpha/FixB family protein [Deltaproteobacteria bacterium]|nr:MAG: electron transfer flavoprotein subunit alpha/FixB family protein [Deltaproteobacteria bacterium]
MPENSISQNQASRNVWVLAEYRDDELLEVTLEMLGDARQLANKLGSQVEVILPGVKTEGFVPQLGQFEADRVYQIEHPLLEHYSTDAYLKVAVELVQKHQPSIFILPGTPNGQDLASCLAARLRTPLVSDCVILKVDDKGQLEAVSPGYGDKIYIRIACSGQPLLITLRPGVVGVEKPKKGREPEVVKVAPELNSQDVRTRLVDYIPGDPRQIDLVEADRIVGGGRGVGGPEGFQLLEKVADLLGAAIGGTRVAVDNRWIPFERQIGQTGKTIAPKLYLTAGISGASHHLLGAKDSEVIIAINTDPNANIFKNAQLKVCADLHQVLPQLAAKLEKLIGEDK